MVESFHRCAGSLVLTLGDQVIGIVLAMVAVIWYSRIGLLAMQRAEAEKAAAAAAQVSDSDEDDEEVSSRQKSHPITSTKVLALACFCFCILCHAGILWLV